MANGLSPNLAHLLMVDNPPQHPQGDFAIVDGRLSESGATKLTFSGVGVYHPSLFASVGRGQAAKLAPNPAESEALFASVVSGEFDAALDAPEVEMVKIPMV